MAEGTEGLVLGGMGGVFVPIVIEFAAKGADIAPTVPLKWSGMIGVVVGGATLVGYYVKKSAFDRMKAGTRNGLIAFAASSLATGISILALEQLRKSTSYTFRSNVPLIAPQAAGLTAPVGQIIKEV
jgi:hypothetical protein